MARFQLTTAHSFGGTRLKAGKTIADPGDHGPASNGTERDARAVFAI
jgi:hypothetical protein